MTARVDPTISVIIATRGRAEQLERCLAALARQVYSRDCFEVIVVDDGSPAPPTAVVREFGARLSVTLLEREHGGPGAARNAGAEHARGRFLAFTDDDCRPHTRWLSALSTHLAAQPELGVGGRVANALIGNPYATATQLLVSYLYEYYDAPRRRHERFFCTNNLALPTRSFREIGGFDTTRIGKTGEDRDLCGRWLHTGRDLAYAPDAVVYHAHHLTALSFLRQHWRYGQGALYVHRTREQRTGSGPAVDLSFYLGMLRYPFRAGYGWEAPLVALLLGVTQATYGAGLLSRFVGDRLGR
jgi:glycosyltransferase involved in cell wall biosynthesis